MNKKNNKFLSIQIIFLLLWLLSLTFISAQQNPSCVITTPNNCQAPNNILMYFSGTTNAHASLTANFPSNYVLCCNFEGQNSCDGDNKILGLSSSANAHAERPESNLYNQNICYTGFSQTLSSNSNPGGDFVEILPLSSTTNAHLGLNYNFKIYGIPVEDGGGGNDECVLTSAYWKIGNDRIDERNRFVVRGDSVNLVAESNNLCNDEQVSFKVVNDENQRSYYNVGDSALSNGMAVKSWTTILEPSSRFAEYYFNAIKGEQTINSGNQQNQMLFVYNADVINQCRDYLDRALCIKDPENVARNSVQNPARCEGEGITCACRWFNDEEPECKGVYLYGGDEDEGICKFNSRIIKDCEQGEGFMTTEITAEWTGPEDGIYPIDCIGGTRTIECPTYIALPFFNIYNFIISILVIGILYGVLVLRKKNRV